jgi:hypothetical protein
MPVNETGSADRGDCNCKRVHMSGRSCVIHMLWNGFLVAGDVLHELACGRWAALKDSVRACGCPAAGASCDQAAGSGRVAAEKGERNAEPAMRLTNKLSAATAAMARCRRRV